MATRFFRRAFVAQTLTQNIAKNFLLINPNVLRKSTFPHHVLYRNIKRTSSASVSHEADHFSPSFCHFRISLPIFSRLKGENCLFFFSKLKALGTFATKTASGINERCLNTVVSIYTYRVFIGMFVSNLPRNKMPTRGI